MNYKIFICIALMFAGNGLFAQNKLNEYLETAARNNPALKAKFNDYNATLEKIPQAGALPDPQLTFGYFIMPVETKNGPQRAKISFTQMFPWFGTLNNRKNIYISVAKSKYEDFEEAKSKLFFDVKSTYYDLYFIKKSIDITIENIALLEKFKRLALIKIEAGTASAVDELRVELEQNDLENDLALLKDKWYVNKVKFNNLLNVAAGSHVEIPGTVPGTNLKYSKREIMDTLAVNNHLIKSLDLIKESFVFKEKQGKKQGSPDIFAGFDYSAVGKQDISSGTGKDALMLKVGITIPLYRKKYSAMVKEAVIQQQIVNDRKFDKTNMLNTLFEKVYSEYSDAVRRIELYKKQSIIAARAIKLLENEYANSGYDFVEILRMERKALKYSLELEKARADKQVAIAFINYLMGM